jgi:hypothetical protein
MQVVCVVLALIRSAGGQVREPIAACKASDLQECD